MACYCSEFSVLFTGRNMGKQKSENRHAHAAKDLFIFMDAGNVSVTLDENITEIFTYTKKRKEHYHERLQETHKRGRCTSSRQ